MAWTKVRLGELIEPVDERNSFQMYADDAVRGISTEKKFIETKANLSGVNLSTYKIVKAGEFAYVADTSRRGDKIAIAYNDGQDILISSIYTVFKVKDKNQLSSDYLFMYFNRPEFDRFARFHSWGSARETFSWDDFGDIEIELPEPAVQERFVAVYRAMVANRAAYERGLSDLKLACDAYIDKIKRESRQISVGEILTEVDPRNKNGQYTNVQGINIDKQFMPSVANTNGVDLSKYKIVRSGEFAFSGMQTGRDECIRIALYDKQEPIIISPAYSVLEIKRKDILPEYVMLWFSRKEIDRLGWFLSDASIRTNLDMDGFYSIKIPIPEVSIQRAIVNIYEAYLLRKEIAEQLGEQMRALCPILIKGSLEEGKQ